MKSLLKITLILMGMSSVALAEVADRPYTEIALCTIEGTEYALIKKFEGTKAPGKYTPFKFHGVMTLLRNGIALGSFEGAGIEIYTGKHTGFRFVGTNTEGQTLNLDSPYGYEFLPFTLDLDTHPAIHLQFEWESLKCGALQD